jgi:hypothetical protein
VLRHVTACSARDEVSDALARAVAPLGDVLSFCPDAHRYRYLVVATRGVIFGFAIGTSTVGFRLDPALHARALRTGASEAADIGPAWATFILFRDDWPEVDLRFWARKAYVFARESASDAR